MVVVVVGVVVGDELLGTVEAVPSLELLDVAAGAAGAIVPCGMSRRV